ncbi:MAG: hypothetical protein AUH15_00465 [Acidobacteriales bacterium 13_2_20CM_55_8]|jgi:hypothetical protein|nr:MAG: hypothetical protein AUH15_00465 [Acidobacteriales bacterium 13_2_20CM_55_8]
MDDMFQRVDIPPVPPDISAELRSRLGSLELNGSHRRFLVNRMGGTGSSWLVKLLNTHPEVFCYHEGVIIRTFPASSYGSEDIISFIRWLALDDMKGAYKAVGDVGSAWIGHLTSVPKELFTTGILFRHPARMLNTRLNVFKTDKSFTEINVDNLRRIAETWGINGFERSEMDQIFLQDLYNFKTQIDAANSADIVIQLELMSSDLHYCEDILSKLTGRFYERALVEPMLNSPVNRRSQGAASIQTVLDGFTEDQRAWYRAILQDSISKVGYDLDNELAASNSPRPALIEPGIEDGIVTRDQELNTLKQMLVDQDRQIARLRSQVKELENIWKAVQASVGWRLMNLWRKTRKRLLPAGTRARRLYDSVLRRFRGSMVVSH